MSRSHHFLVDPIQHLGGEPAQVVLQRLQRITGGIRPIAVAEPLADGRVLVGQFLDSIIVGVQP